MTLQDLADRGLIERDVPLGPYTTYKSGGPARYFAMCEDMDALALIGASGAAEEVPVLVVGRGSNLVVADRGFPGLVLRLGAGFSGIDVNEEVVSAGGAAPLARVARSAAETGRAGLEFFVGVPGSVGGAVRQNAGCFGSETRDRLVRATVVDLRGGATSDRDVGEFDLSYRHSNLKPTEVVVEALFETDPGDVETGLAEMKRITRWRRDNQPGGTLNAGSVFKNPVGGTAGEIIDHLGLKGLRIGEVSVSERHANFFVAGAGATSEDIMALVRLVKDRVFEETGTILEPEIQFVGFDE